MADLTESGTPSDWHVPAHVPPELVVDFDMFAPPGVEEDVQLAWRRLHDIAPDVFWTPRNGGHWIATRAEDIETIQIDYDRFSHRNHVIPMQPRHFPSLPLGVDPPRHGPYRKLIARAFLPKEVDRLERTVRQVALGLLDKLEPRGECEFMEDFARVLPVTVILGLLGLPQEDRPRLIQLAEMIVRTPGLERRLDAQAKIREYLGEWIPRRLADPGDDLISYVVTSEFDGRAINEDEMYSLCSILLVGGLDTVASMMGFICKFLAEHPEHRRQLADEPQLMRNAVEELIRRHGVSNTARYVTHDFEFGGAPLKEGDLIQIPNSLFGLDERKVADPLRVDFHRDFPSPHAAFGNGVHTCPGAILARREIKVFLEEWLKRIPDFQVKPGTKPVLVTGRVSSVVRLELSWTPTAA
ncbi:MAG: cytochrome P450 [Caulobacteraceae bacterium]|nr:cytochrome P450 [Caulobacteraceae bacterium]